MTTKSLGLKHVLRPSKNKNGKAPVIIMLHGYGSDENDLFSFSPEFEEQYLIVSARAPIRMQPYGNAWYAISYEPGNKKFTNDEQAIHSRELIVQFIDEVVENYHADPEEVTLFGFSQGAILSYAVGLSYPEKVNQVVAMSGYIHRDLLKQNYQTGDFSNLRVYSSHGFRDLVMPVDWDRKTKPFLDQLNIDSQYAEFPVGHGVSPENFKGVKAWLR